VQQSVAAAGDAGRRTGHFTGVSSAGVA
jgi:hypothetical protein